MVGTRPCSTLVRALNEPDQTPPSAAEPAEPGRRARAQAFGRSLAARAEAVPGAETAAYVVERERRRGGGLLAGGLAYRFFFWLVSIGAVLGAISSIWAAEDPADLENAARSLGLTATAAESYREVVDVGTTPRWVFLVGGTVLALWFGLGAVRALCIVFALAWRVEVPKIRRPVRATLTFNAIALAVTVGAAGVSVVDVDVPLGRLLGLAVLLGVDAAVATAVLAVLPHAPGAKLRDHLPGAALLALGNWGINVWVAIYLAPRLGDEESVYGGFGTSTAILLWLFVTARLFTLAAFVNATLRERR
ncbi:MAG TPA: YhjD/YihY/BrkB family envelope integrity protein [Gaiellaceae bacterium]|nr:YhjD/YihY/BrkB family envelope integrity protein [Gaiellaceae bacterium]